VLIVIVTVFLIVNGKNDKSQHKKRVKKPPGWVGLDKDHNIKRRKADNHNSYGAPVITSYGDPAPSYSTPASGSFGASAPAAAPLDLHNKEFCVDVSTYQPVVWVERDGEECKTDFVKQCDDKSENVCADVTETVCEVVPYKECKLDVEPQQFTETKLSPKKFIEKSCTQTKKSIPHKKLLPECRNVTKQNCVTNWETDSYGKQVWAGTDSCEPVTWQECELVPKDVQFIVPEITCKDHQELWYHEPEPKTDTRMTNTFKCEVKSTTNCKSQTRPDCKQITWDECREVPIQSCSYKKVHVPTQELLHRKKCLLPDAGEQANTDYGAPQDAPLNTYQPATQPHYSS